jgi:hypothetical protein
MEVVGYPTKSSIVIDIDDHMYDLGNNFSLYINEVSTKQPNTRYLCRLTHDSYHKFTLRWAHVKLEDLNNIPFYNNLESLLDYTGPVTTVITIIFATLECIRRYYEIDDVFFVRESKDCLDVDIYI